MVLECVNDHGSPATDNDHQGTVVDGMIRIAVVMKSREKLHKSNLIRYRYDNDDEGIGIFDMPCDILKICATPFLHLVETLLHNIYGRVYPSYLELSRYHVPYNAFILSDSFRRHVDGSLALFFGNKLYF